MYIVFTQIDLRAIVRTIQKANWIWLFFALLFFIFSKGIAAFRLNQLLRKAGVFISEQYNLKLYHLGMYYNLFLPGGIGGDGYKVYLLNKQFDVSVKSLVWVMLLDRLFGVLALSLLLVLLIYFLPVPQVWLYLTWLCIPLAIVFSYFLLRRFFPAYIEAYDTALLLSFGVQLVQVMAVLCIMQSLGVVDLHVRYIWLFLLSSIAAALPFTIGGAGARELTFLYGAKYLALDPSVSVALSLVFYCITAVVSLAGGYFSWRKLLV